MQRSFNNGVTRSEMIIFLCCLHNVILRITIKTNNSFSRLPVISTDYSDFILSVKLILFIQFYNDIDIMSRASFRYASMCITLKASIVGSEVGMV